ncbi:MAG: serine hydrolase domain-containing protein [Granulosicoccus sp.]
MSPEKPQSQAGGFDHSRLARVGYWLDRQVSSNRLAGASVLIGRGASQTYFHASGVAGLNAIAGDEATAPEQIRAFERDTVVRLYSMTKPVTTVAALMLFEQGKFQLDDPVAWYLPAFADVRVWNGSGEQITREHLHRYTEPAQSPITIRQLMNHTAGFTYGFMNATAVDGFYRDQGLVFPGSSETLEVLVDRLAQAPLLCQPGSQWNYSVATDVLGRLVEIWSGQSLRDYFESQIFQPLGMSCTGFHVRAADAMRFADLYGPAAGGDLGSISGSGPEHNGVIPPPQVENLDPPVTLDVLATTEFLKDPPLYSGGGGLVGTIDDYGRFCQCLLNGGELDGVRLLGRKTVEFMRQNQLPGNRDMAAMGQAVWSETSYNGIGFGLGFAVVLDPVQAGMISSRGEHHWGGAASTFFWIDPVEDLYVILLTQLLPSSSYPLRKELRTAVYQAMV